MNIGRQLVNVIWQRLKQQVPFLEGRVFVMSDFSWTKLLIDFSLESEVPQGSVGWFVYEFMH